MTFAINVQELRERACKRIAGVATVATLQPDEGSKVARVARVALVAEIQTRTGGNPLLTAEQADQCHAPSWGDAEIEAFADRRGRLLRWGYGEQKADDLAERLTLRDREQDDRVLCGECRHHRPGRCGMHKAAGLHSPDVGRDLASLLQRCPAFTPLENRQVGEPDRAGELQ